MTGATTWKRRRNDELVQFISRAFGAATVAIVLGTGVFLALFSQRANDESWARRSSEVSRLAREIEIAGLQRRAAFRANVLFGTPITAEALGVGNKRIAAQLDSLRELTATIPDQRARADRIAGAFARWDSTLVAAGARGRDALPSAEAIMGSVESEVDAFAASEARLYQERLAAAHRVDRVIIGSAIAALIVMLVTLVLLRRRLLAQAHDKAISAGHLDLRNAQLIDQTRQLEQTVDALQASETRFRTLVDSLHDVVFTIGHEKRYTGMYGGSSTPNANALAGYIGKTATEILGPEAGRLHEDAADRALRGEAVTYDWSSESQEPKHFYNVTISPLRGPAGEIRGAVGINRDVTDQVVRDRELAEARDQLRQSQRLEALGQLAGGVAHDFNNLLTIILTYAVILQEEAQPGSDQSKSIEEIRVASERAAALTRQLLAFSRRQMLQPRAIDLNDTVRDVERMFRRIIPPDIALETNLANTLGRVMADPGQIEQVLVNLVINARDAMPKGGRLRICTANVVHGEPGRNGASLALRGPHALVTVSDTGVGMSPEVASKAFEPFFTTKSFGKGTGLGLATAHGIIEQSGGRLTVESVPGKGTTFYIRLPLLPEQETPPEVAASGENKLRGTETILLVDDNEELRRVVKRMLSRAGYRVIQAPGGAAALAHLDQGSPVDLVMSDVMMPEMDGKAVLDAIRQRHSGVKVLLMSGYNYDTALRGMAQRGDVAFIEKPFTAERLLQKLREVLGQPLGSGAT